MSRLLALLMLIGLPALAQGAWQQALDGQRLTGQFQQTKTLPALSRPLQSQGRFIYDDQSLTWETLKPFPSTLIMSQQALIQRLPGLADSRFEVADNPVAAAMASMFAALFSGDKAQLARQFQVTEQTLAHGWQLRLVPTDPQLTPLLERVVLSGADWPERLEIAEKGNRTTLILLSELKLEPKA